MARPSRATARARVGVGLEHHVLLGREQRAVAERLAGDLGVLGRHEVGVRAAGAVAGQLEHLRAECREHAPVGGHGGGDRVELVEVPAGDLASGFVYSPGWVWSMSRWVADADAEQGAAGVVGLERGEALAHLVDARASRG